MFSQPRKDLRYLRRRLPLPEPDFRDTDPQGAMMVHFGESQIFKWKMAQPLYCLVGRKLAFADLLK